MNDNQESSRLLDKIKFRGKITYAGIEACLKYMKRMELNTKVNNE